MIQCRNESNRVFYVDPLSKESHDDNAGTIDKPLATIQEALDRLRAVGSKKGFVRYRGKSLEN